MAVSDDTPWVSVSLIGEAAFCARAARFQYEEGMEEDTGDEQNNRPSRGWFRKPYSLAEIRKALRRKAIEFLLCFSASALAAALALLAPRILPFFLRSKETLPVVSGILSMCLLLGACALLWWALKFAGAVIVLAWYGAMAVAATARVPDPNHTEPQKVYWWSLLQSGFQRVFLDEPLRDTDWRVVGHPWCILETGSYRIPVFRKRTEEPKLHRQYFARIAAYAHLIEKSEGAKVPYGIVLLGHSFYGMTVPVNVTVHTPGAFF